MLFERFPTLHDGGFYTPDCVPRQYVAIIVPYRDRVQHLRVFLNHMHNFLSQQHIAYDIFVVEQIQNQTFNRAKLINVGYQLAQLQRNWDCIVLHDVDLLPLDLRADYACGHQPRHLSGFINKYNFK